LPDIKITNDIEGRYRILALCQILSSNNVVSNYNKGQIDRPDLSLTF